MEAKTDSAQPRLFGDFSANTKAQWVEKVQKDLKGASFEEKLVWDTGEGFTLEPFYNQEDLLGLGHLSSIHQAGLDREQVKQGFSARSWHHCEAITVAEGDEKRANILALNALNQGSSALAFEFSGGNSVNWKKLFQEIQWQYCATAFHFKSEQWALWESLLQYWEGQGIEPTALSGYALFEDLSSFDTAKLAALHKQTAKYPNFQGLAAITGKGKTSDKVGDLLHQSHRLVQALEGQASAKEVLSNVCFHFTLDTLYFFQIAGMRSLRFLLRQMAEAYGAGQPKCTVRAITGITIDESTKSDPEWNMLTNTTQAMSGVLGGCDYLTVQPHNQGIEQVDAFSNRIARNISNLLRDESYFDKVADPVAGSYYLEQLTEKLSEKAWENFQRRL